MPDPQYKAIVPRGLEDLIPGFLRNRHKELDTLRTAVAASNTDQLCQLGHRMKGVGNSYGFAHVSAFGQRIEDAALRGDAAALRDCITEYAEYLSQIQITYE
jgi:HPt (histidine-containing phosphotransfer) domain-containing protein